MDIPYPTVGERSQSIVYFTPRALAWFNRGSLVVSSMCVADSLVGAILAVGLAALGTASSDWAFADSNNGADLPTKPQ